jgi:hypothetical protein
MPGLSGLFGGSGGNLLVTGQTTQYNGELDDGFYEMGLVKSYTVLTTGQYSGTSNIDLIHLTDTSIAFAATTPGTITDTNNNLAIFQTGDVIVITGSALNDGVYNVSTGGVAGTIRTTEATVLEAAGPSISIAKREALSNNCVRDNNTRLMWARYTSAEQAAMGAASDGKMEWTGELYDIFQYCAAANAASLGGHADWRVPNWYELFLLTDHEGANLAPDGTAFPSWPVDQVWTSTTRVVSAANARTVQFNAWQVDTIAKTTANFCALVRGGV